MNRASWTTELKSHTETQEFSEQQLRPEGSRSSKKYKLKTLTLAFSLEHIGIDGGANPCSLSELLRSQHLPPPKSQFLHCGILQPCGCSQSRTTTSCHHLCSLKKVSFEPRPSEISQHFLLATCFLARSPQPGQAAPAPRTVLHQESKAT